MNELIELVKSLAKAVENLADVCSSHVDADDSEYRSQLTREYNPIEDECRRIVAELEKVKQ